MMGSQRGASVLQLSVAVIVIGVLMVVLLDRVDFYRELVEKTAMEQLAREMGWALRLRAAELMLANRNDQIGLLDGANPIEATEMQVANYAGAGASPEESAVRAGRWFFNTQTRELVYFPELTSNFVKEASSRPRVAWRAIVVRQATQPGGRPKPLWVRFELVQPYRWFEAPAKK
jgi:hypothetical protein